MAKFLPQKLITIRCMIWFMPRKFFRCFVHETCGRILCSGISEVRTKTSRVDIIQKCLNAVNKDLELNIYLRQQVTKLGHISMTSKPRPNLPEEQHRKSSTSSIKCDGSFLGFLHFEWRSV